MGECWSIIPCLVLTSYHVKCSITLCSTFIKAKHKTHLNSNKVLGAEIAKLWCLNDQALKAWFTSLRGVYLRQSRCLVLGESDIYSGLMKACYDTFSLWEGWMSNYSAICCGQIYRWHNTISDITFFVIGKMNIKTDSISKATYWFKAESFTCLNDQAT